MPSKSFDHKLKEMIARSSKSIRTHLGYLDSLLSRLSEREARLKRRALFELKQRNMKKAKIMAEELSKTREMLSLLKKSRLHLESTLIRLGTIKDLHDIVSILSPALMTVASIRKDASKVMPETERVFSEIFKGLSQIVYYATGEDRLPAKPSQEEILREAQARVYKGLPAPPLSLEEA